MYFFYDICTFIVCSLKGLNGQFGLLENKIFEIQEKQKPRKK